MRTGYLYLEFLLGSGDLQPELLLRPGDLQSELLLRAANLGLHQIFEVIKPLVVVQQPEPDGEQHHQYWEPLRENWVHHIQNTPRIARVLSRWPPATSPALSNDAEHRRH